MGTMVVSGSRRLLRRVSRLLLPEKDQGGIQQSQGGWKFKWKVQCVSSKRVSKCMWKS
jgi:hypothetical protein